MDKTPSGNETGLVVEVHDDIALVRLQKQDHCYACNVCQPSGDNMVMTARNQLGAVPGDRVIIERPPEAVVKATFLAFVYPTVVTITCAFLVAILFPGWGDTGAAVGGLIGLLGSLTSLAFYDRRLSESRKASTMARIVRVVKSD